MSYKNIFPNMSVWIGVWYQILGFVSKGGVHILKQISLCNSLDLSFPEKKKLRWLWPPGWGQRSCFVPQISWKLQSAPIPTSAQLPTSRFANSLSPSLPPSSLCRPNEASPLRGIFLNVVAPNPNQVVIDMCRTRVTSFFTLATNWLSDWLTD